MDGHRWWCKASSSPDAKVTSSTLRWSFSKTTLWFFGAAVTASKAGSQVDGSEVVLSAMALPPTLLLQHDNHPTPSLSDRSQNRRAGPQGRAQLVSKLRCCVHAPTWSSAPRARPRRSCRRRFPANAFLPEQTLPVPLSRQRLVTCHQAIQ